MTICNYLLTTTSPAKNCPACRRVLELGPQPCPYLARQHACPHNPRLDRYILGDEGGGCWAFAIALADSFHYRTSLMTEADIASHWLTQLAGGS